MKPLLATTALLCTLLAGNAANACDVTINSGTTQNLSDLQADPTARTDNNGYLHLSNVCNNGLINIASGVSVAIDTLSGSGTVDLRTGGLLELAGSATGNTITFSPHGGTLQFDSTSGFGVKLGGFSRSGGDVVTYPSGYVSTTPITTTNPANSNSGVDRLVSSGTSTLGPGGHLVSANGRYELVYDGSGYLINYDCSSGTCTEVWRSGSSGGSATQYNAQIQTDGNFVVYWNGGSWATGTCCGSHTYDFLLSITGEVQVIDVTTGAVLYEAP